MTVKMAASAAPWRALLLAAVDEQLGGVHEARVGRREAPPTCLSRAQWFAFFVTTFDGG